MGQNIDDPPTSTAEAFAHNPINPAYYKGDYVMRIIEDFELGFHSGQVVKYVLRAGQKGSAVQDLEKARWYLDRLIANLKSKDSACGS